MIHEFHPLSMNTLLFGRENLSEKDYYFQTLIHVGYKFLTRVALTRFAHFSVYEWHFFKEIKFSCTFATKQGRSRV